MRTNSTHGVSSCTQLGCLKPFWDRDLQAQGLQLSEYEIISMLSEQPDRRLRMSEIAELVVQSRSRLTHTAGRLEKRGWVRREACASDRRGIELVLTDAGYAEIQQMAPTHVDMRSPPPRCPPVPRRHARPGSRHGGHQCRHPEHRGLRRGFCS